MVDLAFFAGRCEKDHRELMAQAQAEGDEAAMVEAVKIIDGIRAGIGQALDNLKRYRARLVTQGNGR